MRIELSIKADDSLVSFSHQHLLVGTLQKWLGENDMHGKSISYSFSRLNGGKLVSELNSILFADWANMFVSAHDPELIRRMLAGIRQDPEMFKSLCIREVTVIEDPDMTDREIFFPASPILLKRWREDNGFDHIVYTDEAANALLTENLRKKLQAVGIDDPTATASFVPDQGKAKVMLIDYRGVKNKASWCPIRIIGNAETKLFAWNAGIGNSTGIGFGAIK